MSDETKIQGMGSIPHAQGVAFRVWAPHAQQVAVIGSFNDWDGTNHPMQVEENGYWYASVAEAHAGDPYRFLLFTPNGEFKRIDPYAREVTNSVGNAIVHDPSFDWQGDDFHLAPWNELVIYELHVGTFNDQEDVNQPGRFPSVSARSGIFEKARRRCDRDHADRRVCGRPLVGLQPRPHLLGGDPLRRPVGVQTVRQAHPPGGHRGDPGRCLQPPGSQRPRSLAVRRLVREQSRRNLLL